MDRFNRYMQFYYTYVLKSLADERYYIGFTQDLRKRIYLHNSGQVNSTKERQPLELVYYEACLSKQNAIELKGKNSLRLVLEEHI